ncbi:tandem-95 repeat protein [Falsiroseomonas sp. HW251]|uniref:beta strand repeat-containing protein n=1 Tax=Falsiroseomonas sp. HW251 TaxID=3390998 RepID=UPI003D312DC5
MAVTGTATAGADTLIGDNADDVIRGAKGNDRVLGGGGRDTLWGDEGSDTLDGGTGTDTAAYLGKASAYQVTQQANGSWLVKDISSKNGPTDLLTNIERLQFDDRIVLLAPDAAPVALADTAVMNEDGAPITLDVLANDSDADRDALSLTAIRSVSGGTASIVNGKIVFTAAANFNGTATITYAIAESLGALPVYNSAGTLVTPGTAQGTVTITVNAVNDAPTAPATRTISTTEDVTTATVAIGATDIDGDALTFATKAVAGQLTKGSVAYANGGFTYTPNANANGTDSFAILVSDGKGGSVEQLVTVTIAAVNDAPTADATRSVATTEDTATAYIAIGASDVDGDTLSYSTKAVAGQLTKGSVAYANGGFTYTPNANANGTDSFTILISDGKGGTTEQRVSVGITPVNDAPTGQPVITGTVKVGETLTVGTAGLADADGLGSMTYTWQVQDGALWTTIGTGATHTIGSDEIGKALRVVAAYVDGGGTQESSASVATALVQSGLRMTDAVVWSGAQYSGQTFSAQLRGEEAIGAVSFLLQDDPAGLISWFDPSGSIGITLPGLPAGTTVEATFVATDESGVTDTGTVTLHRTEAALESFAFTGGEGDDLFFLPSGHGTVTAGGGSDLVFAEFTTGNIVVDDSGGGESLTVQANSVLGSLTVSSTADRVFLNITGLGGALTLSEGTPVTYGVVSRVNGLSLGAVESLQASYISGDATIEVVASGSASLNYVSGNVWLSGQGVKSASHVQGSVFLSGGGTLIVQDSAGTATLMGDSTPDTLRAAGVQGGAALDGRGGHDFYQGPGAVAATGLDSFESFVLRAGEVEYDIIAGFDGTPAGGGDEVMLVGYGEGSVTLEYAATATLPGVQTYVPGQGYVQGPPITYVSEKGWRIDGTEDGFTTVSNTWQTSAQDPVTGYWTWTWHVQDNNFDPLADIVWA